MADLVWERFGDVPNYVEPFFGSGAVLLARPTAPRIETVNDADCYLANFWRAMQADPEHLAALADYPVNEADLHARHLWLVKQADFRERIKTEPDFYDVKIAAWWVWGISQWIGGGFCALRSKKDRADGTPRRSRPELKNLGLNSVPNKRPRLNGFADVGVHKKRPNVGDSGTGKGVHRQLPDLGGDGGAAGRGVHASGRRTHLGRSFALQAEGRRAGLVAWFGELQARLRNVRVCCGDWSRIMGPSPTSYIGLTGVFLDPPYGEKAGRAEWLYAAESMTVAAEVHTWAIAHGHDPKLRIALCGYDGEHEMPADWECMAWKAGGGYANRAGNNDNAKRERIWFSPNCLKPELALL